MSPPLTRRHQTSRRHVWESSLSDGERKRAARDVGGGPGGRLVSGLPPGHRPVWADG